MTADRRSADRTALMRVITPMVYSGGNQARLLRGGDALFPAMVRAIEQARHEIWLATYIYDNMASVTAVTHALVDAARRGVHVKLVVDGFGSRGNLPELERALCSAGVELTVFRPLHRWWSWLQPSQLRRLHQKICVVDGRVAFVGGINMLDDCYDQVHGWSEQPRLDFAVELRGPVVAPIEQAARALWTRAHVGRNFAREMAALARSAEPVARARRLLRRLRMPKGARAGDGSDDLPAVRAAFVMRDNMRQRRAIERSYIHAIRKARTRVDLISPYFYPGRAFMRVLINAARRGVQVRLLLQGKVDYRIAAVAAQALYDQLLSNGVQVYEYTPAFLHAKVGLVDDEWATIGSSNIDPLSLLLNLEANVVIRDADFVNTLATEFDNAVSASREIDPQHARRASLRGVLRRGFVAWVAHVYLRVAGITGRY